MNRREAVARAIACAALGEQVPLRQEWEACLPEADAAIAADETWRGEQRLKAHEHMVSNPAWWAETFGRDREDDVDEAQR
jgi:hypothetical protein